MRIIDSHVIRETGESVTVEFVAETGEVASVRFRHGRSEIQDAVEVARGLLADFAGVTPAEGPAKERHEADRDTQELEDELETGLEATFPASDPVSVTGSTIVR